MLLQHGTLILYKTVTKLRKRNERLLVGHHQTIAGQVRSVVSMLNHQNWPTFSPP